MAGYGTLGPQAQTQVDQVRAGIANGSIPRTPAGVSAALGNLAGVSGDEMPALVSELTGGGGASGGGLYKSFTVPGSDAAMTGARELQTTGTTGLNRLLQGDFLGNSQQSIEDALYGKAADDINRQADVLRRNTAEGMFNRNTGESTITTDALSKLDRERLSALGTARQTAITGAGTEARADLGARLAALGQAFNTGNTGVNTEANIGLTNAGREQQANTTQAQLDQSQKQFDQSLNQQTNLQDKAFANSERIASENRLASGIGGGVGGVAQVFAPTLNRALQSFF